MTTSQIVVVMISVIIGATLKSISGIGMPFVTIPAISYVTTIEEAIAVGALPNLALNVVLAWAQRDEWPSTRDLTRLSAFAFVGGAAGTFLLVSLPSKPLIAALILVVLTYVVLKIVSPEFSVDHQRHIGWRRWWAHWPASCRGPWASRGQSLCPGFRACALNGMLRSWLLLSCSLSLESHSSLYSSPAVN